MWWQLIVAVTSNNPWIPNNPATTMDLQESYSSHRAFVAGTPFFLEEMHPPIFRPMGLKAHLTLCSL
jgi:hypothetical protein